MFEHAGKLLVISLEDAAAAMKLVAERNRVIIEGASACAVAAAISGRAGAGTVVAIVSGGNIDLDQFARLAAYCTLRRIVSTHAVDAAARRRRGRAEPHARKRGAVEVTRRAEEELAQRDGAAADIAAHQVGIAAFQRCRGEGMARQNPVAETRGKPFHLLLDGRNHVFGGR